jgi:indolepyruvate ferredoxin oxidoreductase alpha subunit
VLLLWSKFIQFESVLWNGQFVSIDMNKRNQPPNERRLLSGNEAIAFGAIGFGVGFCTAYPGTPSTEIMETLMLHASEFGYYTEWSTNEKVALEAAAGASWMGIPSICSMKSLGLNVAADFLLNVNLSGTGPGGLVIVVCDDPRGHSSSNEQDSRFYAKAAKIPIFEPTSCQEARDIMGTAFEISQKYMIPVLVRSTTRLSHSRSPVTLPKMKKHEHISKQSIPDDLFNIPNPHWKHKELEEKIGKIREDSEELNLNTCSKSENSELLIVASGICYRYVKEALDLMDLDSISIAKVVTSFPLVQKSLLECWNKNERILFVEENDAFIEDQILALFAAQGLRNLKDKPIEFFGKKDGTIPFWGELNTEIVMAAISKILGLDVAIDNELESIRNDAREILIPRPLTFCAGCTHRNVYYALNRVKRRLNGKLIVAGDIGCYSLGVFYNDAMNTMQAMGSGIGVASGLGQLHRYGQENKIVAVAGDSTFFHSCIPALINARHHNADLTFIILDNETTAMTGFQEHPGSSHQIANSRKINIRPIIEAIQPDWFDTVDSVDVGILIDSIHAAVKKEGLKVLHLKGICRLEESKRGIARERTVVIDDKICRGSDCKICVSDYACTALEWSHETDKPVIVDSACIRCGSCITICPHNAIRKEEE